MVNNLSADGKRRWVQSLDQEDPLEEGTATHSNTLPGESHGERSLEGCSPLGCKESDMAEPYTHNP